MAQYRQSGHHYSNGTSDHFSIGIRASTSQKQYKPVRARRSARSDKDLSAAFSIASVTVFLCLVLLVTALAYYYLTADNKEINDHHTHDDDFMKTDLDFFTNVTLTDNVRVLGFGQDSVHGRDSRYWDKDDRRRDGDYDEDDVEHDSEESRDGSTEKGHDPVKMKNVKRETSQYDPSKGLDPRGVVLYNENGRNELRKYEEEYEASLKNAGQSNEGNDIKDRALDGEDRGENNELVDADNEYDDGIDSNDMHLGEYGDSEHDNRDHTALEISHDARALSNLHDAVTKDQSIAKKNHEVSENMTGKSLNAKALENIDKNSQHAHITGGQSTSKSRMDPKRKGKRRKFSGSCEMKFLNSTSQLVEPFETKKFARFSLQYVEKEEKPNGEEQWEPRFAGHQSLQDREESFLVHDQKINCGFVKGPKGFPSTGFDLAEDDANYISRCHIAVISCIFGNSDRLRSPATKMVTRSSKKNVCFVMFMDEITLQTLSSDGHVPDRSGFIGLWKVVVVKNLPYTDMRRVGKIPKLLPHRLFPSARYSIWLDSKLRLQLDPMLVLEYFLWRKGHEYAISKHYDRHCVWEEVAQNKRLNKYNHTVIDQQFNFYQSDGLKKFDASDPNKLLAGNVPEGSLIVRAHTPMSNLFSCLWFNEVDRFTPRDQLSFAYTYQKLRRMNTGKPFYLNMFKDCERRAVAKLFRHRSEEKRNILRQQATE